MAQLGKHQLPHLKYFDYLHGFELNINVVCVYAWNHKHLLLFAKVVRWNDLKR